MKFVFGIKAHRNKMRIRFCFGIGKRIFLIRNNLTRRI